MAVVMPSHVWVREKIWIWLCLLPHVPYLSICLACMITHPHIRYYNLYMDSLW